MRLISAPDYPPGVTKSRPLRGDLRNLQGSPFTEPNHTRDRVSTQVEAPAPVSRPLGKGAGATDFADPSKSLFWSVIRRALTSRGDRIRCRGSPLRPRRLMVETVDGRVVWPCGERRALLGGGGAAGGRGRPWFGARWGLFRAREVGFVAPLVADDGHPFQ